MNTALVLSPWVQRILDFVEPIIFKRRAVMLWTLGLITIVLLMAGVRLKPDAGYEKTIPLGHPYMATYAKYRSDFGGANLLLVSLERKGGGDIYDADFLDTLKQVTDEVFFLQNIDRARVSSIFTPNVRYVEVVEEGLSGGDVIPSNYAPTPEMIARVRSNVRKSGVVGLLVSNDEKSAMVIGELLETDPLTGKRINYAKVADQIETIRQKFESDQVQVQIVGFAKVVGDMTDATNEVVGFFGGTLLLTSLLLWAYCGSFRMAWLPLSCALISVFWNFGLLVFFGLGLDPFAILVPFLILAISVSHGVQYVNAWVTEVDDGADSYTASVLTFRRFFIPGTVALLTAVVGFATIALIDIAAIRQMALNASLGCMAIIVTNKILMPIWLSFMPVGDAVSFKSAQRTREALLDPLWHTLKKLTRPWPSKIAIACGVALAIWGLTQYPRLHIGDVQRGVPELRPDSRFNRDMAAITANYAIGSDILKVVAQAEPDACIRYDWMEAVDRFGWRMRNVEGVTTTLSAMDYGRLIYQGLNEGRPSADLVPRNPASLSRITTYIPTTSGLLNGDCSALAITLYLADHKAETLARVVQAVKDFNAENEKQTPGIKFLLATGNAGVMAATNEVIHAKEKQVVLWVYAVIILFVWLSFRDLASVIAIGFPLAMVSVLAYAVMALLDIGLKVATLPVLAMAVGLGVDYGIYHYAILQEGLAMGLKLEDAHYRTLQRSGKAVIFTGLTLGLGVSTWLFSDLQFQRDMGLLLTFMFLANMIAAVLLVPALARYTIPRELRDETSPQPGRSNATVRTASSQPQFEAIIIGAGFSGLCMAIKLKQAGISNFVILEQAPEVGGTWWANTYPGCACDIPSHLYSFSFAQNPDWSRKYPSQPELLAYLKGVADRYQLRSHIRFGHAVTAARFDEFGGFWRVLTAQGEFTGRVQIAALGGLSIPAFPSIPGIESFAGQTMHSAQWDARYDFRGKRVAVIGTGASAIQIVPAIAPSVATLKLFQRTPPWIQPRDDQPMSARAKFLLRWVKPWQWLYRTKIFLQHEFRMLYFSRPRLMQYGHAAALVHMHGAISDMQLRARLTPNYVMGCKRVLVSDDYYPALMRPNVELLTAGIREITASGIRTQDGVLHKVDCIVFGTGFQVTENPNSAMVRGRGGRSLVEAWRERGEEGYLGTLVKDFPNLFMMIGPNAGTGHNSLVYVCEQQAKFVVRLLKLMRQRGARTIEVKPEVQDAFNLWAQDWFKKSVWGSGCKSWYQNQHGKVIGIWPGYSYELRNRLARSRAEDFLFES